MKGRSSASCPPGPTGNGRAARMALPGAAPDLTREPPPPQCNARNGAASP